MAKDPTRKSSVLGPDGTPLQIARPGGQQGAPTSTGVRSVWTESVAAGLDPRKLAALLKAANAGDNHDFLVLAEEMEERDGHYPSVPGQRKRAVSGLEPIVTPTCNGASDEATDAQIAEAVEELIGAPDFADMVDDALDAIAKGYCAIEILRDTAADRWTPAGYIHRDPCHFQFDKLTGRELRIRDDGDKAGLALAPYG